MMVLVPNRSIFAKIIGLTLCALMMALGANAMDTPPHHSSSSSSSSSSCHDDDGQDLTVSQARPTRNWQRQDWSQTAQQTYAQVSQQLQQTAQDAYDCTAQANQSAQTSQFADDCQTSPQVQAHRQAQSQHYCSKLHKQDQTTEICEQELELNWKKVKYFSKSFQNKQVVGHLQGVDFTGVNCTGTKFSANFGHAHTYKNQFQGANLTNVQFLGGLKRMDFARAMMDHTQFRRDQMKAKWFLHARIRQGQEYVELNQQHIVLLEKHIQTCSDQMIDVTDWFQSFQSL